MLITKEVEMTWTSSNQEHYKALGYEYKWRGKFIVPVEHLPECSNAMVIVECDYCGKRKPKKYVEYYSLHIKGGLNKDACSNCRGLKQAELCEIKYGVSNPSQLDWVKEKKKQTNLEHWGVETYSQTPEFLEKFKATNREKLGVDYPMQSKEIRDKSIATCLDKYGAENVFQNEEIQNKQKATVMEVYGVENVRSSPKVINKIMESKAKTLYKNGTAQCSRQQQYISDLLDGELNYPIGTCNLDIAFPKDKIYIEYDGSGHDLNMQLSYITEDEFKRLELRRYYYLKNLGWKMIRIISKNDLLPSDNIMLNIINEAKEYLKGNHSWIKYDIDNSNIITSKYTKEYNYGELQKITKDKLLEQNIICVN